MISSRCITRRWRATEQARSTFFTADYVRRLNIALAPHVHLFVTRLHGRLAAAGIFVEYGGMVQAHLAGSSEALKALSPLKVLLDDVRRWAHARGNRVLHLGGGRAARDDSLLAFKGRFSNRRHQFHVGRWILDPKAYALLCAQRLHWQHGDGIGEADDFFPRYRSPLCEMEGRCPGDAATETGALAGGTTQVSRQPGARQP